MAVESGARVPVEPDFTNRSVDVGEGFDLAIWPDSGMEIVESW